MKKKIIILLMLLFVVVSCTKNQEVQKNNSLPDNQQENNGLEKIKECEKDLDCPQPKCIGVRGLCDAGVCKLQGECLGQDDLKPKDKECNADLDCVKGSVSFHSHLFLTQQHIVFLRQSYSDLYSHVVIMSDFSFETHNCAEQPAFTQSKSALHSLSFGFKSS